MGYGRDEIDELSRAGEEALAMPSDEKIDQIAAGIKNGNAEAVAYWNMVVAKQKTGDREAGYIIQAITSATGAATRKAKRLGAL